MLTRTSHSALPLPNKAPEGTGMCAQEQTEKSSKQIHRPPLKMHGTFPLLLLWSSLLERSHMQGFLHLVYLDVISILGFFKMHEFN